MRICACLFRCLLLGWWFSHPTLFWLLCPAGFGARSSTSSFEKCPGQSHVHPRIRTWWEWHLFYIWARPDHVKRWRLAGAQVGHLLCLRKITAHSLVWKTGRDLPVYTESKSNTMQKQSVTYCYSQFWYTPIRWCGCAFRMKDICFTSVKLMMCVLTSHFSLEKPSLS